jgi:hypothetical protein
VIGVGLGIRLVAALHNTYDKGLEIVMMAHSEVTFVVSAAIRS